MRQNGKDISYSEEDSLTYVSVSLAYDNKNYDKALPALETYLQKFPMAGIQSMQVTGLQIFTTDVKILPMPSNIMRLLPQRRPINMQKQSVLQAARISYFEIKDYARSRTIL